MHMPLACAYPFAPRNRSGSAISQKRLATKVVVENAFFEHLGLVGAFVLVASYDLRKQYANLMGERHGRARD
jgi:hypothetical protein